LGFHRHAVRRKGRPLSNDPFNLARFIEAQEAVWPRVQAELGAGRKKSHWMWFVFPQVKGLGHSAMAQNFAITGRTEAFAYLAHQTLGPRLREVTRLVLAIESRNARDIFGSPDDLKFHSSMTLFDAVAPNDVFAAALRKYFDSQRDSATLGWLG
jgi:uncharacterized protein (DUF1810 family)